MNCRTFIRKLEPYLYVFPCLVFIGLFVYLPLIRTFSLSLYRTNTMGEPISFIGIKNYRDVLISPEFLNSCAVTFGFVILTTVPAILLGLVMALLTQKNGKGNSFLEAIFSMPVVISSASGAMIWMLLLNPSTGFVNYLIQHNINWFRDEQFALVAVAALTVWLSLGVDYIFFLTGLRNIPQSLIEASDIDGAGSVVKFFKILLPLLSPTLFFILILNVSAFAQTFTQISILTQGGPFQSTNVLVYSIYNNAFVNDRYDIASVQSILLFLIMLAVTLLQFRMEKKVVYDF